MRYLPWIRRALVTSALLASFLIACESPPPAPDAGPGEDAAIPLCIVDVDCDDGVFCNGIERCAPADTTADRRGCTPAREPACMTGQRCDEDAAACVTICEVSPDADGDGVDAIECGGSDCDDADPRRFPGNVEVCDAAHHDEDCDATTYGARDRDRDTFDDASCCNRDGDVLVCGTDCDDAHAGVSPTGTEVCNDLDDDCDGSADEGVLLSGFADLDGDLHGDPDAPVDACPGAPRFSLEGDDCDDTERSVHGAQVEICDLLDNDCDEIVDERTRAVTWYRDQDGDGFGSAGSGTLIACEPPDGYSLLPIDCDDTLAGVSPLAVEACNGRDDDCNGAADYRIGPNDVEDDDGDGFVDVACGGLGDDCDDEDPDVHPGATEVCDGRDADCDGAIADGVAVDWYLDADGDGYGAGAPITQCDPPTGRVRRGGDCDDSLPGIHPGRRDDCDGRDQDCDSEIDEDATRVAFYADADGDGAGGGSPLLACAAPAGHGLFPTDCDDADPSRYEGAVERCNLIDDDCDGAADEAAEVECGLPSASGTCQPTGSCTLDACAAGYADCDGDVGTGCEVDLRSDAAHCGSCTTSCPSGPESTPVCASSSCGITCSSGYTDCDGAAANGCEARLEADPDNCGTCGRRCPPRPEATNECVAGACVLDCRPGFADCNGDPLDGCEVEVAIDPTSCGTCARVCPAADPICVAGDCYPVLFSSDGSEGAFEPTADVVLSAGVHHFTRVHIPTGVTVRVDGNGVLEIYASDEIVIDGVIDVSGGAGGIGGSGTTSGWDGGGGHTGTTVAGAAGAAGVCAPGGGGGSGAVGGSAGCGAATGGGHGAVAIGGSGTPTSPGAGGGGYAGGAGASGSTGLGGHGASVAGLGVGGVALANQGGPGGEGALGLPYGGLDGQNQTSTTPPARAGGGGSIGFAAVDDLAVASTFQTGSGGGGGSGAISIGGAGGGGGGGALRLASSVRIVIGGRLLARGGRGGMSARAGGGGSGGVLYVAAPEVSVRGTAVLDVTGGAGGFVGGVSARGGAGGLGRIRISVDARRCELLGTFLPPLAAGCAPTRPAVPGRTYIDTFPF